MLNMQQLRSNIQKFWETLFYMAYKFSKFHHSP